MISNNKFMNQKIVYLIGKAGIGKYTIANELSKHNYILCDNHSINNPIFSLLKLDQKNNNGISDFAWECIEKIRDSVFDFITYDISNNYILTNELYNNDDYDLWIFNKVKNITLKNGSTLIPIRLHLNNRDEHEKRVRNPDRKLKYKLTDPTKIRYDNNLINIESENFFDLDITKLSLDETVKKILLFTK